MLTLRYLEVVKNPKAGGHLQEASTVLGCASITLKQTLTDPGNGTSGLKGTFKWGWKSGNHVPQNILSSVSLSSSHLDSAAPKQAYHVSVVLLVNADHRLLYYNVGDFREIGKIVPIFPEFIFLLILLLFMFQFFPLQFIFFLFNRNNLIR